MPEGTKPSKCNGIRGAKMRQRANDTYTKGHGFDNFLVILLSTVLIATLSLLSTASAAQITLGWGPPADGSVVNGYRVYSRLEGANV